MLLMITDIGNDDIDDDDTYDAHTHSGDDVIVGGDFYANWVLCGGDACVFKCFLKSPA